MRYKIVIVLLGLFMFMPVVIGQNEIEVQCGDIIENEFSRDEDLQEYSIDLEAGTNLIVNGTIIGNTLSYVILVFAPNDSLIAYNDGNLYGC